MIDITARKQRMRTMLRHARELGRSGHTPELVETLLAYGGYPEARERFWRTVIAAEVGNAGARMRGDLAPPIRARESAIG